MAKRDRVLRETWSTMAAVLLLSMLAMALGGAAPALMVLVLPAAYYYLFRAPFWHAARMLVLLGFFLEPPAQVPGATYWIPPLMAADHAFYNTLKNFAGVPGGSVSFCFVASCILLWRAYRKHKHPLRYTQSMNLLRSVCVSVIVMLFLWEGWGLVRGGNLQQSFFQSIQMLAVPVMALSLAYAIRGYEDIHELGRIVVQVAIARGLMVTFTYFVICLPRGIVPEYATTHGDSSIFAASCLILGAQFVLNRNKKETWKLLAITGFLCAAMVMNNRRLAFVCAGMGVLAMYLALPKSPTRRRLNRMLAVFAPLLAFYVIAGEGTTHPVFAPARLALSALEQKDHSSDSRDIENLNLVATLEERPLLGSGFGHEYTEVLKVYDIAQFMPNYRYIPHNSVLWLWSAGGLVGFFWFWILPLLATLYGARVTRSTEDPLVRVVALSCVGSAAVWVSVVWGDIGLVAEQNVLLLALVLAIGAKLNAEQELQNS